MPETVTVATLMETVGSIFSSVISMVGTVGSTVVGTPILLLFAVLPLAGIAIGFFRRLLNVN